MTTRKASKKSSKDGTKAKALRSSERRDGQLDPQINDAKTDDLQKNTEDSGGEFLTTNQGVRINDNQNSLQAGDR